MFCRANRFTFLLRAVLFNNIFPSVSVSCVFNVTNCQLVFSLLQFPLVCHYVMFDNIFPFLSITCSSCANVSSFCTIFYTTNIHCLFSKAVFNEIPPLSIVDVSWHRILLMARSFLIKFLVWKISRARRSLPGQCPL